MLYLTTEPVIETDYLDGATPVMLEHDYGTLVVSKLATERSLHDAYLSMNCLATTAGVLSGNSGMAHV